MVVVLNSGSDAVPRVRAGTARLARSRRTATVAAVVSSVFGATLIVWGISIHSATLTGGGVMSVGRGVMAALIVVGIRLSGRHSATFPQGLYKVENVFAASVGAVVLVLAAELARASIPHLDGTYVFSRDPAYALPFFLAAALLGAVMGCYKRHVGRADGCPSLEADANFSFADSVALVIIGMALALDIAGVPRVDAIAGLIVACFLAVIGAWILYGALRVLLDASVNREVLDRARQIAEVDPTVRRVLRVDGRNSGSFVFLHLVIDPTSTELTVAHQAADDLQRRLRAALPEVDTVDIEFGASAEDLAAAVLLDVDALSVASGFQTAATVAILSVDSGVVGPPRILPNPAVGPSARRAVFLAVFLGRQSVDLVLLRDDLADEDARATLAAYGIEVRVLPSLRNLPDAARELTAIAALRTETP